jgi:hypothetical protein
LTPEEAAVETKKTYYLPHFGVYHPNKPGKLRLVFDAAAKSEGVSLNSALLTGPDLMNSLQAVLWRFRQKRVAITADVTDMFHRVIMRKEDRASQRYLWRGMERKKPPDVYHMEVMIFGATSSPSSAIYVMNRNAEEFEEKFSVAVKEIRENFYVDDFLSSCDTEEEATALLSDVTEINRRGSFKLCKFLSNSKKVMAAVPKEDLAAGVKDLAEKSDLPGTSVGTLVER